MRLAVKSRITPLIPRNPQQPGNTGQTKDDGQEESKMPITFTTRSLLLALAVLALTAASFGQVRVSIGFAPPALPIYEQPLCPGDGYIWTPGYWGYDDGYSDYYWVPGTWVMAPEVGFLWTPPYWGWGAGGFLFYDGYWGPEIGFYGGINYGFGYFGVGFAGGRWDNGHFFYNRAVSNVNVTEIHNVYNTTVVNNTTVNRVSYNGGNGGITARPTPQEEAAAQQRHIPPVAAQTEHVQTARSNPQLRASVNQGRPSIAATAKPGEFSGQGAVAAKEAGAPYHPPANRGQAEEHGNEPAARPEDNGARPATAIHPKDLPAAERPAPPNTGNPKLDKKYQQQQDKLSAQQDKERQKLQKQQDQDHERLTQQKANDSQTQQLEQRHQQQTQQLQQRHAAQQQQMQQRQQPAPRGR
jgi:hypothetical protein